MTHTYGIDPTLAMDDVAEGLELIEMTLLNNISGGDAMSDMLPCDTGGGNCLLAK